MDSSIKLGKIWGIPIGVNYSWIFIFLLLLFIMSNRFDGLYPQWARPQIWAIAAFTTVLFFASVVAHELSHSVVAISKGIPVKGITLFIFGGVSQLAHEAQRPMTEFLVAIVGPVTSIVLAGALLGLWYLFRDVNDSMAAISFSLFAINLSLGVFNMLPGFPLDGGRVLRSVIWGITGSYWRATQVATGLGQLLGGLMVVGGILWFVLGGLQFERLWLTMIGGFLLVAATANYRQEHAREKLKGIRVADGMTTDWHTLPGTVPLDSPMVADALGNRRDFLGVLIGGQTQGIVTRRIMAQVPRASWLHRSLAQVMIPWSSLASIDPEEPIFDAASRMDEEGLEHLAVVRSGVLLGFLTRGNAMLLAQQRTR